jgi:hypothetical protein
MERQYNSVHGAHCQKSEHLVVPCNVGLGVLTHKMGLIAICTSWACFKNRIKCENEKTILP